MSKPFTPRPYQPPTTNYILDNPRCAVWGFLGCGKTGASLQAHTVLDLVEPCPTLVIAPVRVARSTWGEEAAKWDDFKHLKISPVVGNPDERAAALRRPADIHTINFENLPWLMDRLKNDWPFRRVIWDEATKLKGWRGSEQTSPRGKKFIRAGGASRLRQFAKITHSRIDRFIELTGEPAPNGLKDLWGQLWFLDKGLRLGHTHEAFMQRWFEKSYDGYSVIPKDCAQDQIHGKLKDICIALKAEDYFDIKKPVEIPIWVNLPPGARKLYKDMEKDFYMKIKNNGIEALNAASKTGKLLQIAAGAAYHDRDVDSDSDRKAKDWSLIHDEKILALHSVIAESNGMPILVAYNFKSDLARLKKYFPKGRHIDTKKDEDDFKAGKISLAFVHPASIGHGVDGFQYVTNVLVFFSRDWNLENSNQLLGRIGPVRQIQAGFNRNVFVYYIMARDTMDEEVDARHKTKRSVQDILLDAMRVKT